jgi:hypothetical protein
MCAQLRNLLLYAGRKIRFKAILPHYIFGDDLQIYARWVGGHSVTTAFTRFRGRSTLYPFFVAT